MLVPVASKYLLTGGLFMRALQHYRGVLAAIVGVIVWLSSLAGEASPLMEESDPVVTITETAPCENRADEAWLTARRKQVRVERSVELRLAEEQRLAEERRLAEQARIQQELVLRNAAIQQISDLVPEEYQDLVLRTAAEFDMDPRILAAVGSVESQWHPWVLGTHGDTGLMQILPSTGKWIASKLGWETYDLFDPATNVKMGAWYLYVLHREYGNWEMALAAYNGGPRLAHIGADFPYTKRVLRVYHSRGK